MSYFYRTALFSLTRHRVVLSSIQRRCIPLIETDQARALTASVFVPGSPGAGRPVDPYISSRVLIQINADRWTASIDPVAFHNSAEEGGLKNRLFRRRRVVVRECFVSGDDGGGWKYKDGCIGGGENEIICFNDRQELLLLVEEIV